MQYAHTLTSQYSQERQTATCRSRTRRKKHWGYLLHLTTAPCASCSFYRRYCFRRRHRNRLTRRSLPREMRIYYFYRSLLFLFFLSLVESPTPHSALRNALSIATRQYEARFFLSTMSKLPSDASAMFSLSSNKEAMVVTFDLLEEEEDLPTTSSFRKHNRQLHTPRHFGHFFRH